MGFLVFCAPGSNDVSYMVAFVLDLGIVAHRNDTDDSRITAVCKRVEVDECRQKRQDNVTLVDRTKLSK